jgi:hypothetical protein
MARELVVSRARHLQTVGHACRVSCYEHSTDEPGADVEHPICDLKHHAGLAHLPSGVFTANAAWLALVVVAYNLARWTANAAGLGRVTTKTLRLTIIAVPARLISSGRRLRLRMPTNWPWADHMTCALDISSKIPPVQPEPG